MNIFERRPLSLILCIMLGGFSLFINFTTLQKAIICALCVAFFASTFIFDNKIPGSKLLLRIFALALSLGILLSLIWSLLFFPSKHYDTTVSVRAKIYDIDDSSYNAKIVLKTEEISSGRDRHKLLLYLDRDTAQDFRKYDVIEFEADLCAFEDDSDDSGGMGYYVSRGISAYLENAVNFTVIENKVDKMDKLTSEIRLWLSDTLKSRTDFQTGTLLTALIVGQREELDGNTRLNFSRIGISHVLALSGMHLAILSAALTKLLSALGINKKLRTAIILIFTVGYMTLTGFSPSVFRAGVMLIVSGILYLLSKGSDSITSLTIAVAFILVCTPHAAYDVSLWLSAFATLGVIVFSEMKQKMKCVDESEVKHHKVRAVLSLLKDGVLVSVFAFSATFAISAGRFSGFSVFSAISTLIFSFLIELMIYSGLLALLLGWLIPFEKPIILLSDFIKEFAELLSDARLAYVSADSVIVKVLIAAFSVFFFLFLVLDINKKKLCITIILSILTSTFLIAEINAVVIRRDDGIIYAPDASGDAVILKSEGNISVIYSGKEYVSSAYAISSTLSHEKITYVDRLILANYSHSTSAFCEKLIGSCKTDVICLPIPKTNDEIIQAELLSDALTLWGCRLEFYDVLQLLEFDDCSLRLFDRHYYVYGDSQMNVFSVTIDDSEYAYVSTGDYDLISADARALLYNAERLFIGTTSSTNKRAFNLILPQVKSLIYANKDILSDEALDYYTSRDTELNLLSSSEKIE